MNTLPITATYQDEEPDLPNWLKALALVVALILLAISIAAIR